jgi:predicted MFS family arabinose efflux permease
MTAIAPVRAGGPALRGRFFYGWVVLAASISLMMIGAGTMFSLAVFLKPLEEEFGWSRSLISGIALVNWVIFGVGAFGWGALSDRIGARRVVATGIGVLGVAMLLSSQVRAAWQLYAAFGILGAAGASAFYVPLSATATRWFAARRGLALGLLNAGMGLGIMLVPPLARALTSALGWRLTMAVFAVLAWLVGLVVIRFIHDRPADLGLEAYGNRPAGPAVSRTTGGPAMSPAQALRQPAFWVIAVVHFGCCAAHAGPIFHMVSHAMDLGVASMTAAGMLGLSGGASIGGRIGSGLLADRFGGKPALVGMLALQAVALSGYLAVRTETSLFVLALLFGFTYGGAMPLYALVTREYFGDRVIGTAFGGIFLISCLGMGLGAYAGGWFFDHLGSYWALYVASTAVGVAAVVLALALRAPEPVPLLAAGR